MKNKFVSKLKMKKLIFAGECRMDNLLRTYTHRSENTKEGEIYKAFKRAEEKIINPHLIKIE